MRDRLGKVWTMTCLCAFLGAMAAATQAYPGYDFWGNVWCELFSPALPGGAANPARPFAVAGFAALVAAALPVWHALPRRLAAPPALRQAMRLSGASSGLGSLLVPIGVDDPAFHAFAILCASLPFLGAMGGALWLLFKDKTPRTRPAKLVGAAAAVPVLVNAVQWARVATHSVPPSLVLPVAQKCATLMLVAWIASLASLAFSG